MIKKLINASMAGMYIGLGATAYFLCDNSFYGSILFCTGIFLVMNYYNMLLTKVVPLSAFKDFSPADIGITFIGNLFGGAVYAYLITLTRLADKISDKVHATVEKKVNDDYISLFIMAFFCAMLVAYASLTDKVKTNNKGLSTVFTFLFITAFVVIGFDHIVANVFYYTFDIVKFGFKGKMIPSFLIVLLGNLCGGLFTGYMELLRQKKIMTDH